MRVRALLFDFDGTLWDSEAPIFQVYEEVYATFGLPLSSALWSTFMGTIGFDAWSPLERLAGAPVDRVALDATVHRRKEELLSHATARPGVAGYLADSDRLGMARAIVSNNSRPWIERYSRQCGVDQGWSAIECADGDPVRAKPRSDLYLAALSQLGVCGDEAVAFEDSPCGIRAAVGAGVTCVAVASTTSDRSTLVGAAVVLDSFEDVPLGHLLRVVTAVPISAPVSHSRV